MMTNANTLISGHLVLLILMFALSHLSSAQNSSYQQGYIVKQNGDTVAGYVKDRSPEPFVSLYKKVRFKKKGSWGKRKFGPDDISAYGYGDVHFVSVPFQEERTITKSRYFSRPSDPRVFLQLILQSDHLTYYHQEFIDDDNSYVDYVPFFQKVGSMEMVRVTQGILGFKKKRLAEYFDDCPGLIEEIKSKQSSLSSPAELFEFYSDSCGK